VHEGGLSQEERGKWGGILSEIVELALRNQIALDVGGEVFKVFQFFPKDDLHLNESSGGARFLRLSGLARIDSDADDTFVLLEMFSDFLAMLHTDVLANRNEDWQRSLVTSLRAILQLQYWRLVRCYQFRSDGEVTARLNYTGIEPLGGISTWFGHGPEDAPDLVVNVNVLRSLLVNRERWRLLESAEALEVVREVIAFLHRNIESGLFRTDRGYSFYIAESFCAMFARLWQVFLSLDPSERKQLDPQENLADVRKEMLSFLTQDLNPVFRALNPLDASLALISAVQLGQVEQALVTRWVEIICGRFEDQHYPYRAYEVFKGKLPTHMVYGSEALTAALVYCAIDELEAHVLDKAD
jgi:hypothetical protein